MIHAIAIAPVITPYLIFPTLVSVAPTLDSPRPAANATVANPAPVPVAVLPTILTAVFLGSAAVMLFFNWRLRFDLADDAYIHLRIAHNLLRTGHPYFNPGEPVMVTSSPVWTLLLAFNELLFGSRNNLWAWNAVLVGVAASASYRLAWFHVGSLSKTYKVAALLLPVTVMACLANSYWGMETALAIALLLLAVVAFLKSSPWALPLLTFAAFTRYELAGALAVAGVICLATRTGRRYGAAPASVIAGILAAWLFKEFGTIIPNAVAAKSKVYAVPIHVIWTSLLPKPFILSDAENLLLLLGLGLVGSWAADPLRHRGRREPVRLASLALMIGGISLLLLYVACRTFIFPWYVALVQCPVLVGALSVTAIDHSWRRRIAALILLPILFLNVFVSPTKIAIASMALRPAGAPLLNESRRVHVYLSAGALLHQACPQSELMTSEIGALGYSFQGYVSDGVGIASPGALKYHPMAVPQERSDPSFGAIPPRFVRDRKPDLIFTYDIYAEAVTASPEIHAAYDDLRFYPVLKSETQGNLAPVWGARTLHVFVKKAGGCDAAQINDVLSAILVPKN